ncbi:MAG: aminotransferase class I/II-fold pyridoxal phosphate-dependent enzyme [Actinomycetaceae bacterium]|nr:aminotransferase class I/II-fold pyridoxal phosphate-dependent enzyme [Actinomycetaceae bacterium]
MVNFDGFNEERMFEGGMLKWNTPGVSGHWVAEMDFGTAPVVEEAIHSAIRSGFLGYMPPALTERLQRATVSMTQRRYGWSFAPEEVSLASSVLDGLRAILGHMLEPGSRVIVPTPAYMPFLTLPGKYGHEAVEVPSLLDDGVWRLDFEAIEEAAKTSDLLIICNPWNPTGRVLELEELKELGRIAVEHDLLIFNDEIHAPLVVAPQKHIPFASISPDFADRTVTAVAASKGFNLAGLHCAQMITTGAMKERFEPVAAWLNFAAPIGALASAVAYEQGDPWLAELNKYLRGNAELITSLLAESNLSWSEPQGTYLGIINAEALGSSNPSEKFLEEARVRMTPGAALGKGYEQYVRFGFASSRQVVERSIRRMIDLTS